MDGDLPAGDARSITARTTGCIVLAPRAAGDDDALDRLLRDRGYAPRTFHDPHLAMVELCLLDRAHEAGAAWSASERPAPALVIVRPHDADACRQARDLVEAVRRHLPRPRVWMFADGRLAPLAGQTAEPPPVPAEPPTPTPTPTAPRHAPAPPRLVGTEPDPPEAPAPPDAETASETPADPDAARSAADEPPEVTAEEIAMLLGATTIEEPRR
jgi:hypothetical protein